MLKYAALLTLSLTLGCCQSRNHWGVLDPAPHHTSAWHVRGVIAGHTGDEPIRYRVQLSDGTWRVGVTVSERVADAVKPGDDWPTLDRLIHTLDAE